MTTKASSPRSTAAFKSCKAKPVTVEVYFVIRAGKCELATSSKNQATSYVESFNKVRPSHVPAARLITRTIEI